MSLRQITKWEFKCDRTGCGATVVVEDGMFGGRPHDWFGPKRDDGYHECPEHYAKPVAPQEERRG